MCFLFDFFLLRFFCFYLIAIICLLSSFIIIIIIIIIRIIIIINPFAGERRGAVGHRVCADVLRLCAAAGCTR